MQEYHSKRLRSLSGILVAEVTQGHPSPLVRVSAHSRHKGYFRILLTARNLLTGGPFETSVTMSIMLKMLIMDGFAVQTQRKIRIAFTAGKDWETAVNNLAKEALASANWAEGDLLTDSLVISNRSVILAGYLSTYALLLSKNNQERELRDALFLRVRRCVAEKKLFYWGESASPYFYAALLLLQSRGDEGLACEVAASLVLTISRQNKLGSMPGVREAWKRLNEQVLDYAVSIMRSNAFIDHTDEINSVYALVPIVVYCFDKKGAHLTDLEIRKMVKWFYYSQIRTRYISQLPQKLDRDLRVVQESNSPFDELLGVISEERILEITPDEFAGRAISHPLFGLMRWYFKKRGAVCFSTGLELRQTMGRRYQLENDHIFPYSKLARIGYDKGNRVKYALAQELPYLKALRFLGSPFVSMISFNMISNLISLPLGSLPPCIVTGRPVGFQVRAVAT